MSDCVFCELLDGGDARWVAREDHAVAFLPLPGGELAPGHTLVIPRAHVVGVLDCEPADLNATIALVQRVGQAMERALGATGVVVLNASGTDSGQSVPHLHFHVVPCWADDEATFWPAEVSAHRMAVAGPVHELLAADLSAPERRSGSATTPGGQ
ncbi:HIT family protein [Actinopolymorpha pittospori]